MKSQKPTVVLLLGWVLMVLFALGSGTAMADNRRHHHHHRGHSHLGIGLGFHFGSPFYYPPPFYYPYPSMVVAPPPAPPPTYIEQPRPAEGYWYYCHRPQGYYPQVQACAEGWEAVAPR